MFEDPFRKQRDAKARLANLQPKIGRDCRRSQRTRASPRTGDRWWSLGRFGSRVLEAKKRLNTTTPVPETQDFARATPELGHRRPGAKLASAEMSK